MPVEYGCECDELLSFAASKLGVSEIAGEKHEPRIVAMLRSVGLRAGDETPWCAAFVNWVMEKCDVEGTGSARARSFEAWGRAVSGPKMAIPGDVVVLWRKNRNSRAGHVGFLLRFEGRHVWMIGGNQRNKVCAKRYPAHRVVAIRRCGSGRDYDGKEGGA